MFTQTQSEFMDSEEPDSLEISFTKREDGMGRIASVCAVWHESRCHIRVLECIELEVTRKINKAAALEQYLGHLESGVKVDLEEVKRLRGGSTHSSC